MTQLKLLQNSKTQIVTKLTNSICFSKNNLTPPEPMRFLRAAFRNLAMFSFCEGGLCCLLLRAGFLQIRGRWLVLAAGGSLSQIRGHQLVLAVGGSRCRSWVTGLFLLQGVPPSFNFFFLSFDFSNSFLSFFPFLDL